MTTVELNPGDAANVGGLLRQIGKGKELSPELRSNVTYWAKTMHRRMDRRDVQAVTGLLLDLSDDFRMSAEYRHSALYWAGYLQGRL